MNIIVLAIIAAIVTQALGWLWHGPLFGKCYGRAMGMKEDMPMGEMPKSFKWYLLLNFVVNFVMALVLFMFMSGFGGLGVGNAIKFGLIVMAGFFIPMQTVGILWNGREPKGQWHMWLIGTGYQLINVIIWALLFAWLA